MAFYIDAVNFSKVVIYTVVDVLSWATPRYANGKLLFMVYHDNEICIYIYICICMKLKPHFLLDIIVIITKLRNTTIIDCLAHLHAKCLWSKCLSISLEIKCAYSLPNILAENALIFLV